MSGEFIGPAKRVVSLEESEALRIVIKDYLLERYGEPYVDGAQREAWKTGEGRQTVKIMLTGKGKEHGSLHVANVNYVAWACANYARHLHIMCRENDDVQKTVESLVEKATHLPVPSGYVLTDRHDAELVMVFANSTKPQNFANIQLWTPMSAYFRGPYNTSPSYAYIRRAKV